jgi:hypothetical protein
MRKTPAVSCCSLRSPSSSGSSEKTAKTYIDEVSVVTDRHRERHMVVADSDPVLVVDASFEDREVETERGEQRREGTVLLLAHAASAVLDKLGDIDPRRPGRSCDQGSRRAPCVDALAVEIAARSGRRGGWERYRYASDTSVVDARSIHPVRRERGSRDDRRSLRFDQRRHRYLSDKRRRRATSEAPNLSEVAVVATWRPRPRGSSPRTVS